jgi:hypothetical protein
MGIRERQPRVNEKVAEGSPLRTSIRKYLSACKEARLLAGNINNTQGRAARVAYGSRGPVVLERTVRNFQVH